MTLPPSRDVQINGSWVKVRGNQILDFYETSVNGVADAQTMFQSVKAKIQSENWTTEPGSNLLSIEVRLRGFRDMVPTELAEVQAYDQSQTAEYLEYLKLKARFG